MCPCVGRGAGVCRTCGRRGQEGGGGTGQGVRGHKVLVTRKRERGGARHKAIRSHTAFWAEGRNLNIDVWVGTEARIGNRGVRKLRPYMASVVYGRVGGVGAEVYGRVGGGSLPSMPARSRADLRAALCYAVTERQWTAAVGAAA